MQLSTLMPFKQPFIVSEHCQQMRCCYATLYGPVI